MPVVFCSLLQLFCCLSFCWSYWNQPWTFLLNTLQSVRQKILPFQSEIIYLFTLTPHTFTVFCLHFLQLHLSLDRRTGAAYLLFWTALPEYSDVAVVAAIALLSLWIRCTYARWSLTVLYLTDLSIWQLSQFGLEPTLTRSLYWCRHCFGPLSLTSLPNTLLLLCYSRKALELLYQSVNLVSSIARKFASTAVLALLPT